MRKVLMNLAMTYDWYISKLDGSVDFLEHFGTGNEQQFNKFLSEVEAVIMWRTTYEEYNKYGWDYLDGKRLFEFGDYDLNLELVETFINKSVITSIYKVVR